MASLSRIEWSFSKLNNKNAAFFLLFALGGKSAVKKLKGPKGLIV
jgi:hypothetical protein